MSRIKSVIEAINYIERHLTEKPDLDIVASAVHYSKYHLHRMFTDTVGLTIHDYVQRRQLTESAKLLVFSVKPIMDIALEAGYESQQAFTNIFKVMYKQSPQQFRKNEVFYPLQLEYEFGNCLDLLENEKPSTQREIMFAAEADIPLWMELVRFVIDGFPNLKEEEHVKVLKHYIRENRALIMKEGPIAIGIMMICYNTGSIDFLGVHPLYRKQGLARMFLEKAICELLKNKQISITTFREGDKADTGYRKALKALGFAEAELLTEFGYPTQKMILQKESQERAQEVLSKFPEEIENLENIRMKLNSALKHAEETVNRHDREYMASKHYLAHYRHEIDPHEIFQNEIAMKQIESSGIFAVQMREKLAKLADSPYFARIDFHCDGSEDAAVHYIGRFSFSDESEILISDWRAPVAGMFYDYEPGRAGYEAPIGRVDGELIRKRQFKISHGMMEYALESAVNIQDDVLQRELSHTSDEKMKSIIATIQREQNRIIRNEKAGTLIIQGVAGSGKTSVALHRIAYLLYRYKDTLSANNVVILSPNKVFADYISNVLPELGEEPVYEMSFVDIADIQLDKIIEYEPDRDPIERSDPEWNERARFKSTPEFVMMMDKYLEYAAKVYFVPADYTFGCFKATYDWILMRYNAHKKYPIKRRLHEVSEDTLEQFKTANIRDEELPKQKAIYKKLVSMLRFTDTLSLYKDFFKVMKIPEKLVLRGKRTLEWPDVYPFMYFHAAWEGLKENRLIRHLVIDEMQDYMPVQYAVMNKLFQCNKTILGDFGQSINPNHMHTLNDFRAIYPDAEIVELYKSYRSTLEIITFAKRIQNVPALDAIERHGDTPAIIGCSNPEDEYENIKRIIDNFLKSRYRTLGIILKTNREAQALHAVLSEEYDVRLLTAESDRFTNGISVTAIRMSKGLEFDEVLIPAANTENYHTDFDRSLLYIACTRAMHRLTLTYTGDLTDLIG